VALEEFTEQDGGVFAELAIIGTESGEEVGIDVEFTGDFAADEDGDDDFGLGFKRASEIAGIGVDVVDNDGFAGGSSGATDTLIKRDTGVRGHGALEGTEDEDVAVRFPFEHIKADPVVAGEFFVEKGDDGFHESVGGGGGTSERVEFGDEVGRFGVSRGHGE
jgi:hypothetical protein